MNWQIQEAKQRFSELVRATENEGPQVITRHGEEVVFMVDAREFHRLNGDTKNFARFLQTFPKIESQPGEPDIFDEIEAERKRDFAPMRDFEIELGLAPGEESGHDNGDEAPGARK